MPLLFSYGTLQLSQVQLETFGRVLEGVRDELIGYEQRTILLSDPTVIELSGHEKHVIVYYTGREAARVPGTVFELTEEELASADRYEPPPYIRVRGALMSGRQAWVYVDGSLHEGSG